MENNIFLTDDFWASVKRKDLRVLLNLVFTEAGFEEAAEIAGETTRMTDASIKRMKDAIEAPAQTDEVEQDFIELDEEVEAPADTEPDNELVTLENAVREAIESGKYKTAKKAYKALEATGLKGSEMKKLKKALKALKYSQPY